MPPGAKLPPLLAGPGVSIGKGSVIGAEAVVLKGVPDGVLVAGNPARIIRAIDEEDGQLSS